MRPALVMPQPEGTPEGGPPCWSAGFLPAVYQGTLLRPGPKPILHLDRPEGVSAELARESRRVEPPPVATGIRKDPDRHFVNDDGIAVNDNRLTDDAVRVCGHRRQQQ